MGGGLGKSAERRLGRLRKEAAREWRARLATVERTARQRAPRLRTAVLFVCTAGVLGALPFAALIRGSLFLHQYRGWPAGLALAAGVAATVAIVTLYATWLVRRVTGRLRPRAVLQWFALPAVTFYALFALVYVSSANLKDDQLRATYRSLHPLLRVALATAILGDRELILTDLERQPEDYAAMGLAANPASLHYPQPDGWVHAVDLRTIGRSGIRNAALGGYFRIMGFATRRHVGTADHLHVSLR